VTVRLETIERPSGRKRMGKITRDPEQEARWAEERRRLRQRVEYLDARIREDRERRERRRERLNRLTLGLLGR
jgi:hypothetical protein